jgi:hypothetical protein
VWLFSRRNHLLPRCPPTSLSPEFLCRVVPPMAPKAKRSVSSLLRERELLNAQVRHVRSALRAASAAPRGDCPPASGGNARGVKLTPCNRQVAVTLYLMAGWSPAPAVDFLLGTGQQNGEAAAKGGSGLTAGEDLVGWLGETVEEWVLEIPVDDVVRMMRAEESPHKYAHKLATVYLRKWKLAQWVSHQNDVSGVAPSTGEMLRQHDALQEAEGGASDFAARAAAFQCRSRVWATRFRRRLGVNLATPVAEEPIGVEERQRKAPQACAFGCGRVPKVRTCAVPN